MAVSQASDEMLVRVEDLQDAARLEVPDADRTGNHNRSAGACLQQNARVPVLRSSGDSLSPDPARASNFGRVTFGDPCV